MFFFQNNENSLTFKTNSIEQAYLNILDDNLEVAKTVFSKNNSPRANWGISLTEILTGYINRYPTYFEIRNFFEIDLEFLIKNNKIDYIEYVLGSIDLLCPINAEIYKFTSRVMLNNEFFDAANIYLEKAKRACFKDAELHFLITKYNIATENYAQAQQSVDECLRIMPDYIPAKKIKAEIINKY